MVRPKSDRLEALKAARQVADFASAQGVPASYAVRRASYEHAGALVADAVLQAGLNYRSVVLPRIERILAEFPEADRVSVLIELVQKGNATRLLNWEHSTKIERFERLITFLHREEVDTVSDLRISLSSDVFCAGLRSLNGVGPKTIDYMCCLVGMESIAVDRHIRNFANKAGVESDQYDFLKDTFCFAADLLSISRREFDAWVWSREAQKTSTQLGFSFEGFG